MTYRFFSDLDYDVKTEDRSPSLFIKPRLTVEKTSGGVVYRFYQHDELIEEGKLD